MENKDLQAIDDAVEKQAEVLVEQEMERQNVDSKSDGAKPAMKVKDLYFSYGKNKVLKGVSLQIAAGKITTIMGANGCGKSTLFSLMTKNLYTRKGNIFLSGKNIQNLNLKEFAQRVWIAMALAQNTKILFLDEPTTYLDIRYQIEILQLVQKLNREYGITIIMVLHDINQAITYSDYVIGLKDGQVLVEGDPEEVITAESIRELYGIELGVTKVDGRKFVLAV